MIGLHANNTLANSHYNNIKNVIQNRIKNVLKDKHIKINPRKKGGAKKQKRKKVDKTLNQFLILLTDDIYLRKLITFNPKKMEQLIRIIKIKYPAFVDSKSDSNRILYNIFISNCYDNEKFSKLNFISDINLNTCPYCNRSYTYILDKADKIKPQIDHFFPKSKYPFLGMSFYNLIPSCQLCNGLEAKAEKDPLEWGLKNPYEIKNSDFIFSYNLKNLQVFNPLINRINLNNNNLSIELTTKMLGHLKVFKLDKLYNKHLDHVIELIIKSKLEYTDEYREYLKEYPGFTFSNSEIDRMIIGNYADENDIHKRPLAKLYQDIARELNLIK